MNRKSNKAKMGRPRLPPEKRKRASMGFRPTPDLHGKLENAAAASGLSLTQEVERRLERSFAEEPWSAPARVLTRLLGTAMGMVEQRTGKDVTDYETYVGIKAAISGILDSLQPPMSDDLGEQSDKDREKYPVPGPIDPDAPVPPTLKSMLMGMEIGNFLSEFAHEKAASAQNTKTAAANPRKTD